MRWYAYYQSPGVWELLSERDYDDSAYEDAAPEEIPESFQEFKSLFMAKQFLKRSMLEQRNQARRDLAQLKKVRAKNAK